MHIYIYMYIYRERERERSQRGGPAKWPNRYSNLEERTRGKEFWGVRNPIFHDSRGFAMSGVAVDAQSP